MNKALTLSLVACSIVLCVFVGIQWKRESNLRAEIRTLTLDSQAKTQTLGTLDGTLKTLQNEIARLDALKVELTASSATNRQEISQLQIELRKEIGENETISKQLESYKSALQSANASIQKQNESIQKQNTDIRLLTEQRSAAIAKQNEVTAQYNTLATRFNELQKLAEQAPGKAGSPN